MKSALVKSALVRFGAPLLLALGLASCGGGGGGGEDNGGGTTPPPPGNSLKAAIEAAAADPSNDASLANTTSGKPAASFTVLQNAGLPAITVNSPMKVNFTVFSNGQVLQDIKLNTSSAVNNVRFSIAKLVPGTNGDPDKWVNYVSRVRTTSGTSTGPDGQPAVLPSAIQATTDPYFSDPTALQGQLVYNSDGYYTYTFQADIKDPAWTTKIGSTTYTRNGVAFEPNSTHRIAIQLSYNRTNADGTTEVVKSNPYFDFTIDASGNSVQVTDPSKTRTMVDVSSCNSCHDKLAFHGGGRIDTQYCVTCHNSSTQDPVSGNFVTFSTMVHKIHAGRGLAEQTGGEEYYIGSTSFAEVGFPQDLRNCTKCHTGANPATPQGDNWKTAASKEACLTCHANNAGSDWDRTHTAFAGAVVGPGAGAKDIPDQVCKSCHKPGTNLAPERVHYNQIQENYAKYKMNIESATFNDTADHKGRSVTVKYYLSDPTNGNAAYNLVTSDCTSPDPRPCGSSTKFGNLRFYITWPSMVGQTLAVTEYTAYNNGGSGANAYASTGTNDGSNHYTVVIPLPDDTDTSKVQGTAQVMSYGQVKEPELVAKWATDPRPEVVPTNLLNTAVQNASKEFAISGPLTPRRQIVSTEKCNVCHGVLGTASGSNTLANAFHGGARNTVEACIVCHDPNRMSSTIMTNGLSFNESYQTKRFVHGIHGNSVRFFPFTHGNTVVGNFCNEQNTSAEAKSACDASLTLAANVENYAAEVYWPGMGASAINCNACHVNDSYKVDNGPIGAVIKKPDGTFQSSSIPGSVNKPLEWLVITPKAATCTSCHDSPKAIGHVTSFGGAGFGNLTQAQSWTTQEICADCHSSGGFKGVDIVHNLK